MIYTYPSIMAMQYMVLYNESRSLYMATYSTGDETMTFHAKTTGKYSLELSINHYPFITSGVWQTPECSISILDGGWHKAAKIYSRRMGSVFKAPDSPPWMEKEYHGWVEVIMKRENTPPKFKFSEIGEVYRKIYQDTGINHIFLVGWHDNGHDTKFPRYLPGEECGTVEELISAMEDVKAQGGRCSLYTNGRLVDINEEYYKSGGKNAVSLKEDGTEYIETYKTSSVFAVTCPGTDEYCAQMADVTKRIAGDYKADGMFIDQISCNLAPFCYSKNHYHTKPSNNFLPGVERQLKEMRRAHKKINPDFHTFAEGCHERFGQYYDVNQGHGEEYTWQIGKSMPEQFLYTYPDRIVTGHCADKQQMYHSMAQFKPLDVKPECYEDPSNLEPIRRYVALRKAYPEYFLQGKFIDDEGFVYSNNIRVFAVEAQDQTMCISLWKRGSDENSKNEGEVKIPQGWEYDECIFPEKAELRQDGNWLQANWIGPVCYIKLKKAKGTTKPIDK